MDKEAFRSLTSRPVILDGALGTNLMRLGLRRGECPEEWSLRHPDEVKALLLAYGQAGSEIVYAPTFGANEVALSRYGLEDRLEQMNEGLVALAREAGTGAFLAGDLTTTGMASALDERELTRIYERQIRALYRAGVDLLVAETILCLKEARACLAAASRVCSLPVLVTVTLDAHGRLYDGTAVSEAARALQEAGACAVGINCSDGPLSLFQAVREMKEACSLPVVAKPNAGRMGMAGERDICMMTPKRFAQQMEKLMDEGACLVGGCCGTTPSHIRSLALAVRGRRGKE